MNAVETISKSYVSNMCLNAVYDISNDTTKQQVSLDATVPVIAHFFQTVHPQFAARDKPLTL